MPGWDPDLNSIGAHSPAPLGGRAVQPGVEADRGALGGASVDRSRGRLTPISLANTLFKNSRKAAEVML